ncbi:polycystin-1-like protein 1 [Rhynchonycteris naso]
MGLLLALALLCLLLPVPGSCSRERSVGATGGQSVWPRETPAVHKAVWEQPGREATGAGFLRSRAQAVRWFMLEVSGGSEPGFIFDRRVTKSFQPVGVLGSTGLSHHPIPPSPPPRCPGSQLEPQSIPTSPVLVALVQVLTGPDLGAGDAPLHYLPGDCEGSWPADHRGCDQPSPRETSISTGQESAEGIFGDQERSPGGSSIEIVSCWSSGDPVPHLQPTCAVGEADGAFQGLVQCTCPAGPCSLKVEVPSCAVGPPRSTEDMAPELLPWADVTPATATVGNVAAVCAPTSALSSQSAVLPRSPHGPPAGRLPAHSRVTPPPGRRQLRPCTQRHPGAPPAPLPEDGAHPVTHRSPQADAWGPPSLAFWVQMAPGAALCLVMDFGDGSGVLMSIPRASGEVAVTARHQYRKEGVYTLTAAVSGASHAAGAQLGPYYVEVGRDAVSVFMNASSVHGDHALAFGGSAADPRGVVITHRFSATSSWNVSFASQARVGDGRAWSSVTVGYRLQPVSVHTNGTAFATDTDITFVAVTKETTRLEFTWFFGDHPPVRTTSRSVRKRLGVPQWYRVVVQASDGVSRVASEPYHVHVQRRVVANRLTSAPWALVNSTVTFECRLNFGSDVAYLWDFGDGAGGLGNGSAGHVYRREGQFTVRVLAFNDVSAASLRTQLFVVRQPCRPPRVRSSGPGRVQVWRSQPVTLGVTFEAAVLCDISQGLSYTWIFTDSSGSRVPLPPAVSTHRQTLTVPSYVLEPGNYTALAKVQVGGVAVHSNYSVQVEVRPRAPVSVISEGTHLFVPRTPSSTVILSGSLSYDPDRPGAPLRYHWTCAPASTPGRLCFPGPSAHSLDTTAPTLSFTADSLSSSYDQFLVTLTVSSHGWSSSEAQVFLSILPNSALRLVRLSWAPFRGVPVNWNRPLSLQAACEDCGEAAALSYSWDLFVVNATGQDGEQVPPDVTPKWTVMTAEDTGPHEATPGPRGRSPRAIVPPQVRLPSGSARLWDSAEEPVAGQPDLSARGRVSRESMVTVHHVPAAGDTVTPSGDPWAEGPPESPGHCTQRPSLGGAGGRASVSASKVGGEVPGDRKEAVAAGRRAHFSSERREASPSPDSLSTHSSGEWGPVTPPPRCCRVLGTASEGRTSAEQVSDPEPDQRRHFEANYSDIQEAAPSEGRPLGDWTRFHLADSGPGTGTDESRGDGDNLLGPFLPAAGAGPHLLVDWPKSPVSRAVFHSYTTSGTTEQEVTVKPYSLSPGETYVLQATVASGHRLLGKAQLYVTVNHAPRDVACQVQPHRGLEAHTVFSVFCMSGRPDFRYEFSYQIGNSSQRSLYQGRDTQYYFMLPAGEPQDNHQVLVSTVVTDGDGSQTQPCAVAVTVLPRRHRDRCPGEDVYNSSLEALSTLRQMGSDREIRNYVSMTTRVLARWAQEHGSPSCGQWSWIQDALISSVCTLASQDQEEVVDSILVLKDLLHFPNKVSPSFQVLLLFCFAARTRVSPGRLSVTSARLILQHARTLLAAGRPPAGSLSGEGLVQALALLVSTVLEVTDCSHSRTGHLHEEAARVVTDALLGLLSSGGGRQLRVRTRQMELLTQLHRGPQSSTQNLGPVHVRLPAGLAGLDAQSPCYISWLVLFKKSSCPWGHGPGQEKLSRPGDPWTQPARCPVGHCEPPSEPEAGVGSVLALSLYGCSSRRPLRRQRLRTPVTVEFEEEDGPGTGGNEAMFVLRQNTVNVHRFTGLSETPRESLQIRVDFAQPVTRAFPVLLLVRFSEKPTPSEFLVKQTHAWEGPTAHVSVPAASLTGPAVGYLSLLDADYDRKPPNKYLAKAVTYSVRFQGVQCQLWERGQWKPESFSPEPGTSPGKVNCSCDRLAAFSVARRDLNATLETSDVSEFQGHPENLLPSIFIMVFTILYAFLVAKTKQIDHREKKKSGYVFLQEDAPPSHQLYAVVVDTGFRSPARCSAKVHIVLCGENGRSEPRELCCPEKPLFERNSRHTFVLSTPAPLGPLRTVRLWHNSCGASPAWYVSHVMVRELRAGPGHGWFFPAECWLAAGRRDGRVERELSRLRRSLGFWKLLGSKFTEHLEDFHVWASVHSRPWGRSLPLTPRLSVAFTLLCAYACLAALVTSAGHAQLPLGVGLAAIPLSSFGMGFLCTLLASPGAQLLSLLFRLSQRQESVSQDASLGQLSSGGLSGDLSEGGRQSLESPVCTGSDILEAGLRARNTPGVSSGSVQTQSTGSGGGAGHLPPELEAWGADLDQRSPREKSDHCIPGLQVPGRVFEGLSASWRPRTPRPWLSSVAWATCGIFSVACGLGTGFLGYRFGPTQCGQWLCLLTLSVTCCVFVTQPLMVGLLALHFAWKRRGDESFFTGSLRDATAGLDAELEGPSALAPHTLGCSDPSGAGAVERVLAARQRARRLRWARPPSPARLRVTRERMRRQMRAQVALRDACMCVLTLLLYLLTTHGRPCQDEYSLSHAIRNAFTRSPKGSSSSLSSVDTWWDWSLTTLLDGLYQDSAPTAGTPGTQPGALGGKCYLIGPAVIKPLEVPAGRSCKHPRPLSALTEDSPCHPKVGGSNIPSVTDTEVQVVAPSDPTACREDCELSLGRTRLAAHTALTGLRARHWVSRSTQAVSVRFVLYNPPTRLFSSVSLSADLLPAGGLALSALVESVTIRSDSAPRYHLVLPQLPMVAVGLAWYAASGHLVSLAEEAADQLHKGHLRGFVDLSHMAAWNQRARWLQGTLLFLLTLNGVRLLGFQSTAASCSTVCRTLSGLLTPALAGVLMLAALPRLRGSPLLAPAPLAGTCADAIPWLLFRLPGNGQHEVFLGLPTSGRQAAAGCCAALFTAVTVLCFGLPGQGLQLLEESIRVEPPQILAGRPLSSRLPSRRLYVGAVWTGSCSLDEFADLLDELLLKISSLSDDLQGPLPGPRDAARARVEGGPRVGALGDPATGRGGQRKPSSVGWLCVRVRTRSENSSCDFTFPSYQDTATLARGHPHDLDPM